MGSWSSYPQKTKKSFLFWGAEHSPENSQGQQRLTERPFRDGQMDTQHWEECLPGPAPIPDQRTRPQQPQLRPPTPAVWGGVSWLTSTGDTASEDTSSRRHARWAHWPGRAGTGEKG